MLGHTTRRTGLIPLTYPLDAGRERQIAGAALMPVAAGMALIRPWENIQHEAQHR
jgi:hypothetical protein